MKDTKEPLTFQDGWSVQVYGGDRRLLCSLYPSHAWAFAAGVLLGFVIALVGLQAQSSTSLPPSEPSRISAPLNVD